jgi:uncharacterized protein YegL
LDPATLPVFVLADTSGSMLQECKIDAVNAGIRHLIADCAALPVAIAVVTFGDREASLALPLVPAAAARWRDVGAAGRTPLGSALVLTRQLMMQAVAERPNLLRPAAVLLCDGHPTDEWMSALQSFDASAPAGSSDRVALAIGADADIDMLELFIRPAPAAIDRRARVLEAGSEQEIVRFFRWLPLRLNDAQSRNLETFDSVDTGMLT